MNDIGDRGVCMEIPYRGSTLLSLLARSGPASLYLYAVTLCVCVSVCVCVCVCVCVFAHGVRISDPISTKFGVKVL